MTATVRETLTRPRERVYNWVDQRRPQSGAMGVLYQQRRSLYWLIVVVGVLAYAGLVSFLTLSVALLAFAGLRALAATADATITHAAAWFALSTIAFGASVGTTYIAARWASQYDVSE